MRRLLWLLDLLPLLVLLCLLELSWLLTLLGLLLNLAFHTLSKMAVASGTHCSRRLRELKRWYGEACTGSQRCDLV